MANILKSLKQLHTSVNVYISILRATAKVFPSNELVSGASCKLVFQCTFKRKYLCQFCNKVRKCYCLFFFAENNILDF